ncbi:MAG: FecR domain-containing protein [Rhodoferax sp.]|nr:FecR domain-containing protein [Rhodoferax sp.]MDP3653387.1 FecR domain-containing protein [Rhodoferax sp.]
MLLSPPPRADGVDPRLLGEAADWLMRLQSGKNTAEHRRAIEQWRTQSAAHAAAWQRAETVLTTFGQVPTRIGRETLNGLRSPGRRRVVHALGLCALGAPVAWLAWQHQSGGSWGADLRTAKGEQRTLALADGTLLVLNTDSAVDVLFSVDTRRLRLLRGEILVTTARDPAAQARPFVVETAEGSIRPIGTRFSVRQFEGETHAAVFEGAVEIHTARGREHLLHAGEQSRFQTHQIGAATPVESSAALWEHGMLAARDMPLAALIAELARYRPGVLRCHPDVAHLRVSGAFPLRDTDASLELLRLTRPLALRRMTVYWVSVEPR